MRKVWRVALVVAALLMLPQTSVLAWHDTGHMIVSQIAYDRLNPRAKERVDALVKTIRFCGRTYDGVTISVWMDDIKSDSTHDELGQWHYINTPVWDGIAPDQSFKLPDDNVVTRTRWVIEMLKKGTGSDKKDAELLGYVVHLVGDIHQPMHAATRFSAGNRDGDAGGNEFKLLQPEATNLHAYWDAAGGLFFYWSPPRPMEDWTRRRFNAYVQAVAAAAPSSNAEWQVLDPARWAQESYELARTAAYNLPENSMPTDAYAARARDVSRRRLALAGYRLAQLLNTIYPDNVPK